MGRRAKNQRATALWAGIVFCCCALGCSSKPSDHLAVHPVQGKVLFDGKPIAGALVVLHPQDAGPAQAVRPVAYTKDDGSFAVATYDAGDGAPSGKYVATVEWLVRPKGTEDEQIVVPNKLPQRYGNPQSSRLAVEVIAGANDLPPFQLTR
jgi:hypothetical protein